MVDDFLVYFYNSNTPSCPRCKSSGVGEHVNFYGYSDKAFKGYASVKMKTHLVSILLK